MYAIMLYHENENYFVDYRFRIDYLLLLLVTTTYAGYLLSQMQFMQLVIFISK